jgi:pimeloyl-ACP methyl ester carboxylesterase
LLLLHGSGASKDVFHQQFDSILGEAYRLVAIDLPGHGKSDDAERPEHAYTVPALAATVDALISDLTLEKPVVFGWSLGGHVGIELAARRPDISGLALTGTPPIGRGPVASLRGFHTSWDVLLVSREAFNRRQAERYMQLCFGDHGSPEILNDIERSDGKMRTIFRRSLLRGEGVDQLREVETNPVPLAMINGVNDPIVRQSHIDHIKYANLWRGECQYIHDAGHAPFLEQPVKFNAALHTFMQEIAFMTTTESQPRQLRSSHGGRMR